MQSRLKKIRGLDAEVLAISVESTDENQRLAESAGIEFALLSDPAAKVVTAFGLLHRGASMEGGDIARPAVFIIDRQGKVAWRSLTDNWRVRVRPETIVSELEKLP